MKKTLYVVAFLLLPGVAFAAPRTFSELADLATNIINGGIGIALILGIVIYFYGVATSIPKSGKGDMERLRAHFVWGIIALFVMFSVWGILRLLSNTLFGGGSVNFGGGAEETVWCDTLEECEL